jgi:hypothetical protein
MLLSRHAPRRPAVLRLHPGKPLPHPLHRFQYINNAIAREKYLKHFTRAEKIALIEANNPTWEDLAAEHLPPPLTQTL